MSQTQTSTYEPLSAEDRAQGFITLNLITQWDRWVERRVEQVQFVSTSSFGRRHSVDFRMHEEIFGTPPLRWDKKGIHYVPLVLLHKQALRNFDLRDESGAALPMVSRHKNASIGAAALAAWAQTLIHQRLAQQIGHAREHGGYSEQKKNKHLPPIARSSELAGPQSIRLPFELEELFWRLCSSSYFDADHPLNSERASAKDALREVLVTPYQSERVLDWRWRQEGDHWTADPRDPWLPVLNRFDLFRQLAADFARLFIMYVPVEYEAGRRRIVKFSYETAFQGPGFNATRFFREHARGVARRIRAVEDWAEGFGRDRERAKREWIAPRPPAQGKLRPLKLHESLSRSVGWLSRVAVFDVLTVGLGGTFHLEFSAPEGTQVKRATLTARRPKEKKGERRARRFAANVERCHLYLGEHRQGTSGRALVALKPKSSTIIRGAFLASLGTLAMLLFVYFQGDGKSGAGRQAVALLLLAPGLLASYTARGSEHSMTTSMVFGLRFFAGVVALCSAIGAALLASDQTSQSLPWEWRGLIAVTGVICFFFGSSWRLAARAWPHREEL